MDALVGNDLRARGNEVDPRQVPMDDRLKLVPQRPAFRLIRLNLRGFQQRIDFGVGNLHDVRIEADWRPQEAQADGISPRQAACGRRRAIRSRVSGNRSRP